MPTGSRRAIFDKIGRGQGSGTGWLRERRQFWANAYIHGLKCRASKRHTGGIYEACRTLLALDGLDDDGGEGDVAHAVGGDAGGDDFDFVDDVHAGDDFAE